MSACHQSVTSLTTTLMWVRCSYHILSSHPQSGRWHVSRWFTCCRLTGGVGAISKLESETGASTTQSWVGSTWPSLWLGYGAHMECVGPPLLPNLSGDHQPLSSFCHSPIKTLEKENQQLFSLLGTPLNPLNLPSTSHFSIIIAMEACFHLAHTKSSVSSESLSL